MKTIKNLFLLMTMLCLIGCEEDEPQSVSFSVKEIEVGPNGTRMNITIEANCKWTITDDEDKTFTDIKQGEGTVETPFVVFSNPEFEPQQYIVTVTSEDGTSTDILTVNQKEGFGLEVGQVGLVAAEGGQLDVPVYTNDQIEEIKMPDWINFTESKALSGYTYTFTVESNKTGSPRLGVIYIRGKSYVSERIEVRQDSYAPTGIQTKGLPAKSVGNKLSFSIELVPSYADLDKLRISSDNNSSVELNGNIVFVELKKYGKSTVKFLTNNQEIYSTQVERFPEKMISNLGKMNVCIGEQRTIGLSYDSDEYVFTSSNPSAVSVLNKKENQILGTGIGWSTVTVTHPELDIRDSIEVYSDWITIQAEISHFVSVSDVHDIKLGAIIKSGYPMKVDGFIVTDANNQVVLANKGTFKDVSETSATIITDVISIPKSISLSAMDAVEGYKFHVFTQVVGEHIQRSAVVNNKRSGFI